MKRSIRALKKQYKKEQMRQKMQLLEDMPAFLEIVKWHRDVIKVLGIDISVAQVSSSFRTYKVSKESYKNGLNRRERLICYLNPLFAFDEIYEKLEQQFPHTRVAYLADECRRWWLSELMQRETEDFCRTKDSCHYGW